MHLRVGVQVISHGIFRRRRGATIGTAFVFSLLSVEIAAAGNGANFVTYDHHTEDKGVTEVKVLNELSEDGPDGPTYNAQLIELEHAITDRWMLAGYLEAQAVDNEDYRFNGFRIETRYRLFDYGTPFNPVVYLEYIRKKDESLFQREVVGRTDKPAGESEEEVEHGRPDFWENEIEPKLIFGHDFSDRLRAGLNLISEVNLASGDWKFGYAAGLTYTLFKGQGDEHQGAGWTVSKLQLGAELYGGAGDSVQGLTLDPDKTEQYAGISLKAAFDNGAMATVGGAFGLTDDSQDALFRVSLGWEFD